MNETAGKRMPDHAPGGAPDVERKLREEIARMPQAPAAYARLASLLCGLERSDEALALLDDAITQRQGSIWPLSIKAAVLSAERRAEEAVAGHKAVAALAAHAPLPWINYGHALKAVGATKEAVSAYRNALTINPANGSAWWGLADLRADPFGADDVAHMVNALPLQGRDPLEQVHLHFALGKGLGDLGDYERSFFHYARANTLRGELAPYDALSTGRAADRFLRLLTQNCVRAREGAGFEATDPIFIVGMPRSGSTLVEQILASHPQVEGAGELFELANIARDLMEETETEAGPHATFQLADDDLRDIGSRYLRSSRRHRRTDRPFFTDKMPSNWRFVPLILLALPNARIIDVRRRRVACCLSSFTTYFNLATNFPTTLNELAHYHGVYEQLMVKVDALCPGRVLRVEYEKLVDDSEAEIRRLLDKLGLPFDEACLQFHTNRRAVHTPSAQQVRRPIYRSALDHWRNYEPWVQCLV